VPGVELELGPVRNCVISHHAAWTSRETNERFPTGQRTRFHSDRSAFRESGCGAPQIERKRTASFHLRETAHLSRAPCRWLGALRSVARRRRTVPPPGRDPRPRSLERRRALRRLRREVDVTAPRVRERRGRRQGLSRRLDARGVRHRGQMRSVRLRDRVLLTHRIAAQAPHFVRDGRALRQALPVRRLGARRRRQVDARPLDRVLRPGDEWSVVVEERPLPRQQLRAFALRDRLLLVSSHVDGPATTRSVMVAP